MTLTAHLTSSSCCIITSNSASLDSAVRVFESVAIESNVKKRKSDVYDDETDLRNRDL